MTSYMTVEYACFNIMHGTGFSQKYIIFDDDEMTRLSEAKSSCNVSDDASAIANQRPSFWRSGLRNSTSIKPSALHSWK
jgi:hypothetical protein